jgi:drug/metabolite transporter (DMT)-like permease
MIKGAAAVVLWGTLAPAVALVPPMPPFLLTACAFAAAALLGLVTELLRGSSFSALIRPAFSPVGAAVLGVCGLFGYHFFYFLALQQAPPAAASLVAYLWPILIVIFSLALNPAGKTGLQMLGFAVAAMLGFCGAVLLAWPKLSQVNLSGFSVAAALAGSGENRQDMAVALGFGCAILCAFIWSGYTVANRRYARVPSSAVIMYCAIASVAAGVVSAVTETYRFAEGQGVFDLGVIDIFVIIYLGAGPMGASFLLWDAASKHGRGEWLGVMAYAAPVISTILMIALGLAAPSQTLILACACIVGGGILANMADKLKRSTK